MKKLLTKWNFQELFFTIFLTAKKFYHRQLCAFFALHWFQDGRHAKKFILIDLFIIWSVGYPNDQIMIQWDKNNLMCRKIMIFIPIVTFLTRYWRPLADFSKIIIFSLFFNISERMMCLTIGFQGLKIQIRHQINSTASFLSSDINMTKQRGSAITKYF